MKTSWKIRSLSKSAYQTKGKKGYEWGEPDTDIEEIVGIEPWAMDTDGETGERNISFGFDSREEVDAAIEKVKERFTVSTQIMDWTVEDPPQVVG